MVHNLSNGNRKDWDYYFNMNVVEFLNSVAFFKELNRVEEHERKNAN